MGKLIGKGKVRYIGISNFNTQQLTELLAAATIKPFVHQMELRPHLQQTSFLELHKQHNIAVIGYAPLENENPAYRLRAARAGAPGKLLEDPVLNEIWNAKGRTAAQISLAWNLRRGLLCIRRHGKRRIGRIILRRGSVR